MTRAEDILAEYADGLVSGSITLPDLLHKYDVVAGSELDSLLQLAAELETVLVSVAPSPEFVTQLRGELLQGSPTTLLGKLRHLSAVQVGQIAAGVGIGSVTVAAGVLWWYWSRREKLNPLTLEAELAPALVS